MEAPPSAAPPLQWTSSWLTSVIVPPATQEQIVVKDRGATVVEGLREELGAGALLFCECWN